MKRIVITIISLILTLCIMAQGSVTACKNKVPGSYNYWFYTPDQDMGTDAHYPLLIFLHGQSLCGNNLEKVRKYGPIDALKRGRVIDCYVIAPQNPGGSWNPDKIMKIIEWAEKNYKVDSSRIYVYGMSLGGYGTIDMVAAYPDRIAAAMAMCGGATAKDLSGLNKVPLWIVHGTADRAVPVAQSDKVVEAMKAAGSTDRLIYTRMKGVDHGGPARIFYMAQTYDWLFYHCLDDEGRPVNRDFEITQEAMKNAYKDLGKNASMEAYE